MGIDKDFEDFCDNLIIDNIVEMETTVGEIAAKLNKSYYDLSGNKSDHMYVVGSIGRETAIKGVSDLDIIFDLPSTTYKRFHDYETNGQSALLQEVKKVMAERYPKTKLKGDGQVVCINFSKYTVELVPGFQQSDENFKYPNSNDGGSWKITKPLPEIEESKKTAEETNGVYTHICNMLRAWKNKQGFKFGGLLIDTLSYNFLNANVKYKCIDFEDYLDMVKDLFLYLKGLNKDQSYWLALGSNQEIYNTTNGKFVGKAKKAYKKIKDLDSSSTDLNKELRKLFGHKFPKAEASISKSSNEARYYNYVDNEQFISDLFSVDIQHDLIMDCKVIQDGWRPASLRKMIRSKTILLPNKQLEFHIDTMPGELVGEEIYWKVKNVGEVAKKNNMLRGEIKKTNSKIHKETTSFRGEHYVECYIVKKDVCVARSRIDVPIVE